MTTEEKIEKGEEFFSAIKSRVENLGRRQCDFICEFVVGSSENIESIGILPQFREMLDRYKEDMTFMILKKALQEDNKVLVANLSENPDVEITSSASLKIDTIGMLVEATGRQLDKETGEETQKHDIVLIYLEIKNIGRRIAFYEKIYGVESDFVLSPTPIEDSGFLEYGKEEEEGKNIEAGFMHGKFFD